MTLTPEAAGNLAELLDYLQIEILQGDVRKLKDGRTKYHLKIHDDQKAELIKEFLLRVMAKDYHKPESRN